jgi:hypothetical protein
MTRPNSFNLRLSNDELKRLKDYADSKQISAAEAIRQYISRLPRIKKEENKESG